MTKYQEYVLMQYVVSITGIIEPGVLGSHLFLSRSPVMQGFNQEWPMQYV